MPKIDVARLNALRPRLKPSITHREAIGTPLDDAADPMEVDRVHMGRTTRKRKEKVAKHLKRELMKRKAGTTKELHDNLQERKAQVALHLVHFKTREVAVRRGFNDFSGYWETKFYCFRYFVEAPNGLKPVQTAHARTTLHGVSTERRRTSYPRCTMLWFAPGRPISVALLGINRVIQKLHLWRDVSMLRTGATGNGTIAMRLGGSFSP
ncbi:hypothetical protein Bca52824_065045 [Brassica carinata]|uniref:Uncharacterized protein n=1 Tax=Brassica carinata TaxID=52824 RepID=A0A8X7QKY9_BRACI|nr:hypothetical protein Bca52824_065045 [Brassica carinata]